MGSTESPWVCNECHVSMSRILEVERECYTLGTLTSHACCICGLLTPPQDCLYVSVEFLAAALWESGRR